MYQAKKLCDGHKTRIIKVSRPKEKRKLFEVIAFEKSSIPKGWLIPLFILITKNYRPNNSKNLELAFRNKKKTSQLINTILEMSRHEKGCIS